jgi:flagellar motor switch protein FliG
VKFAAQLCNQLDATASDLVLAEIEQRNEDMASKIRNVMFVFEDILSLDAEAVKEMLARVERKNLVIALKGASEQLRKHICGTMSQRAAAMLLDEIDTLGPVKIRAVEEAQREVIESLRELEREGVLSLRATTGDVFVN